MTSQVTVPETAITAANMDQAKLPGNENREQQQEFQKIKGEFMELVRSGVENRMHSNFLRNDKERNKIIDRVYTTFLNPAKLAALSLEGLKELLSQAKALASLADVVEGKVSRTQDYCALQAYLQGCSESEKEEKQIEYWLSQASLEESLIRERKKANTSEAHSSRSPVSRTVEHVAQLPPEADPNLILGDEGKVAKLDALIQRVSGSKSQLQARQILQACADHNLDWRLPFAQFWLEGHFATKGRAASTHNPGNVGNTDSGASKEMGDWESGIYNYVKLMVSDYGNLAQNVISNDFIRPERGGRYATSPGYTVNVRSLVIQISNEIGVGYNESLEGV